MLLKYKFGTFYMNNKHNMRAQAEIELVQSTSQIVMNQCQKYWVNQIVILFEKNQYLVWGY